mmetsp:Transcript_53422/g.91881  ORF Transcript_53422/g.91881 Transcript_53422/m.91881 type:complete len:282 (-) Transcript_53422:174-1019(-)
MQTGKRRPSKQHRGGDPLFLDDNGASNDGEDELDGELDDELVEDTEWRLCLAQGGAIGGMHEDSLPPRERSGLLWRVFRLLEEQGWEVDGQGYATCFRVKLSKADQALDQTQERLEALLVAQTSPQLPAQLAWSTNLGFVDVYPAGSGKKNAGLRVLEAMQVPPSEAGMLCDDDNDLALASTLATAFVPQCTSLSVQRAVNSANSPAAAVDAAAVTLISGHESDDRAPSGPSGAAPMEQTIAAAPPAATEFLLAPVGGVLGTEACLRLCLRHVRLGGAECW